MLCLSCAVVLPHVLLDQSHHLFIKERSMVFICLICVLSLLYNKNNNVISGELKLEYQCLDVFLRKKKCKLLSCDLI